LRIFGRLTVFFRFPTFEWNAIRLKWIALKTVMIIATDLRAKEQETDPKALEVRILVP
jgi:hypothetical protein